MDYALANVGTSVTRNSVLLVAPLAVAGLYISGCDDHRLKFSDQLKKSQALKEVSQQSINYNKTSR